MSYTRQFRHEHKFLITPYDYYILLMRLKPVMPQDPNASENGGYHVRSLYFDDVYDSALTQKNAGIYEREKFRIRIYNKSDNVIKLERKYKNGNYISKEMTSLSREEYNSIIDGNTSFLAASGNPLKKLFYSRIVQNISRPAVITDYFRDALVYPLDEIRITFDKKTSTVSGSFDIFDFENHIEIPAEYYSAVVLEIKYNNFLPEFIRDMLFTRASPLAVSKYVLCRMATEKYNLKRC